MRLSRLWSFSGSLIIALSLAVFFIVLGFTQEVRSWDQWFGHKLELKLLDQMFQWRGPVQTEPGVVIAAIDENSLKAYGQWGSWPRTLFKTALERLLEAGADTVAWDIVFSGMEQHTEDKLGRQLKTLVGEADAAAEDETLIQHLDESKAALANSTAAVELLNLPAEKLSKLDAKTRELQQRGRISLTENLSAAIQSTKAAKAQAQKLGAKHAQLVTEIDRLTSGVSPDALLAETIEEHSGNTVLGFVTLFKDDDPELAAVDAVDRAFCGLAMASIDRVAVGWGVPDKGESVAMAIYPHEKNVSPGIKVLHIVGGFIAPNPIFSAAAENLGSFALNPDSDGVCRRLPLLTYFSPYAPPRTEWNDDGCEYEVGNYLLPSLSLSTASLLLESSAVPIAHPIFTDALESVSFSVSLDVVEKMCRRRGLGANPEQLKSCVEDYGSERIAASAIVDIPTTASGEMLVNYYGPRGSVFPYLSFRDVIRGSFDPNLVRGKVVIVAATALATHDQRVTPFDPFVPGVEVHAAAIQNIIDGNHLVRLPLAVPIESLAMLVIALILGLLLTRVGIPAGVALTLALATGLWALNTFVLFRMGYWFYSVLFVAQIFVTWAGITIFGYLTEGRDKRRIAAQFGTYVSPDYVKELIANPKMLGLSGEERELSVLFSDIRGFTTISERMSAEDLTSFLNDYLTPMTHVLQRHFGTLDKYMGDAIMAFFGAPKWFDDHATQACLTAIEMMDELAQLRERWHREGLPEIDIGIGLNSGRMRVGDMGSALMKNYTILGDNVNLGSRLEGINKQYGTNIIASEATFKAASDVVFGRELDFVAVKGKLEPVRIFEIMGRGQASGWQLELIETFEAGLARYRAQQWQQAITLFQNSLRIRREATGKPDPTSHVYLERVRVLELQQPGPDWNGVWKMTTK